MTQADKASVAHNVKNEDFAYQHPLPEGLVLMVGDFANSEYKGLDKLAETELQAILSEMVKEDNSIPPPILLSQVAMQFNNRLLGYKQSYNYSFQCCVILGAVVGKKLYFLPVGDCRIALVRRGEFWQLNGTLWVDASECPLPTIIKPQTKVQRGPESVPPEVLGYAPLVLSPSDVREVSLEEHDILLLYSDGIDKIISPTDFLALLSEGFDESRPGDVVATVMKEVTRRAHDDDCTLLVATGPHDFTAQELAERQREEQVNQQLESFNARLNVADALEKKITDLHIFVRNIEPKLKNVLEHADQKDAVVPTRFKDLELRLKTANETHIDRVVRESRRIASETAKRLEENMHNSFRQTLKEAVGGISGDAAQAALQEVETRLGTILSNALEQNRNTLVEEVRRLLAVLDEKPPTPDAPKSVGGGASSSAQTHAPENKPPADRPASVQPTAGQLPNVTAHSTPDAPLSPHASPSPNYIYRVTPASRFREGILRVQNYTKKIEIRLVDEIDVDPPSLQPADEGFESLTFAAHDAAPAGWLTAFYCKLLMEIETAPANDIATLERWVLEKASEFAKAPEQHEETEFKRYLKLRAYHWQLRGNTLGLLQPLFSHRWRAREIDLAKWFVTERQSFDEDKAPDVKNKVGDGDRGRKVAVVGGDGERDRRRRWMPLLIILFLPLLALLSYSGPKFVNTLFPMGTSTNVNSANTNNPASSTTQSKLKIVFGADGRMMFLLPESSLSPFNYRVRLGMEHDFKAQFANAGFNSVEEAQNQLTSDAMALVEPISQSPRERPSDRLAVYTVIREDIRSAEQSGENNCLKFLDRINNTLEAKDNHTHLDQLLSLNPDLRCEAMKEGDPIVAYKRAYPTGIK